MNAVDKKGNLVMLPIKMDARGQKDFIEIDTNLIKSAYGRKNMQEFIDREVTEDNLLFVENKKIRNLQM